MSEFRFTMRYRSGEAVGDCLREERYGVETVGDALQTAANSVLAYENVERVDIYRVDEKFAEVHHHKYRDDHILVRFEDTGWVV